MNSDISDKSCKTSHECCKDYVAYSDRISLLVFAIVLTLVIFIVLTFIPYDQHSFLRDNKGKIFVFSFLILVSALFLMAAIGWAAVLLIVLLVVVIRCTVKIPHAAVDID